MLPTVEPSMIPPTVLPLLIFVNVKSGGCQVIILNLINNIIVLVVNIVILTAGAWADIELPQAVESISSVRPVERGSTPRLDLVYL